MPCGSAASAATRHRAKSAILPRLRGSDRRAALIVALVGGWRRRLLLLAAAARRSSATTKPSIAVLPFANLGGDAVSGRLAEGLTDDIITDLTRYRDFDIIARNSVEAYRNQPTDVRKIGDELERPLSAGGLDPARGRAHPRHRAADRCGERHAYLVAALGPRRLRISSRCRARWPSIRRAAIAGSDLLLAEMQAAARRKRAGGPAGLRPDRHRL